MDGNNFVSIYVSACFSLLSQILEEKVEYWMEKYDRDVDQKQHELDVLKVCALSCNTFVDRTRKHTYVTRASKKCPSYKMCSVIFFWRITQLRCDACMRFTLTARGFGRKSDG